MTELPVDPFGEELNFDDACVAIGVSVLDSFSSGAHAVMVTKRGDAYVIVDDTDMAPVEGDVEDE